MYELTLEELEKYFSTDRVYKDYKLRFHIFNTDKKDFTRPFVKKVTFEFNTSQDFAKDLQFNIYRDKIEVSSFSINVPFYASSIDRTENFRKELSAPQRIMEAFGLYLREV